jgi:hypothetical protein
MKVRLICKYCDHKWEESFYYERTIKCSVCGDKNIKVINLDKNKVDYYKGDKTDESERDSGKWFSEREESSD